jgi:hypothetical protein
MRRFTMKIPLVGVLILILVSVSLTAVKGSGTGSMVVNIQGYGTVHGQLQNVIIQANDIVTMSMAANDQLQTPEGSFPLQATGDWNGILQNNSTLSGTIDNIQGKIHVCVIVSCNDVDFIGHGTWTGQLQTSSSGAGNFNGTVTITSSPYSQIPQGQTVPMDGSWTADFASSVPEFNGSLQPLLLATLTAVIILTHRRRRT